VLQCVAACCRVLPCVAVCCSVLQCVAVCCGVLRCVGVCCSVLQCVAVCSHEKVLLLPTPLLSPCAVLRFNSEITFFAYLFDFFVSIVRLLSLLSFNRAIPVVTYCLPVPRFVLFMRLRS